MGASTAIVIYHCAPAIGFGRVDDPLVLLAIKVIRKRINCWMAVRLIFGQRALARAEPDDYDVLSNGAVAGRILRALHTHTGDKDTHRTQNKSDSDNNEQLFK